MVTLVRGAPVHFVNPLTIKGNLAMARDVHEVSIKEVGSILSAIFEHNEKQVDYGRCIVPMLVSDPGVGKTSVCSQVAKSQGRFMRTIIAASCEPQDLAGIPDIIHEKERSLTRFTQPELYEMPEGSVFFIDEITKAPGMFNVLSPLVYERRVGEHKIPNGCTIVAAGNHSENNAGDSTMPSHLVDRLCWIYTYTTPGIFLEWAAENNLNPLLTGFIAHYGAKAFSFNADAKINATARSWAACNNVLDIKDKISHPALYSMLSGYVGMGQAGAFVTYIKWAGEVDSPERIIANPKTAPVPTGTDRIGKSYAIASALLGHASIKTIDPIMTYLERLDSKELVVYVIQDLLTRDKVLHKSPTIREWKMKNNHLFSAIT